MKINQKFTLRMRLWYVLFFNVFAVIVLVGCVAYSYINIINRNKIKNEMQISANNLRYEMDYVYFEPTDEWNQEFSNDRIWS